MKASGLAAAVVLAGCLHALSEPGFAHENHPDRLPDPGDVVAFRAYVMENIDENADAMKAKVEAGQLDEVKLHAAAIAIHATRIEALFPAGSGGATSRAKDEIWHDWKAFLASTKLLIAEADALAVAAEHGDIEAARTHLRAVFGTCDTCHDRFRKPRPR